MREFDYALLTTKAPQTSLQAFSATGGTSVPWLSLRGRARREREERKGEEGGGGVRGRGVVGGGG